MMFKTNPEVCMTFCQYADMNLDHLSVDLMYEYLNLTLIPECLALYNEEFVNNEE
jgi:hypothetical protein